MKKYAVFGNPIAQSLSPTIHAMFAKSCGIELEYTKILAPVDGFEQALSNFWAEGGVGCNVTLPFKEQAYALANECNSAAKLAKAANTLKRDESGTLHAYNTDGIGLVTDLTAKGAKLDGANVLLLGAGGAAKGVVQPLLEAGVKTLHILNRTLSKAQVIEKDSGSDRVVAITAESLAPDYEVVINSTSASLQGTLPEVPVSVFKHCNIAYDMVYGSEPTVFMEFAKENGATAQVDGLGMLVQQAAAAFTIWTGEQPETQDVEHYLRELKKTS